MEFKRFPSIENSYKERTIDKIRMEQKDFGVWVVTEKLDGANFSFWHDGEEIRIASRNQWVDSSFYSCEDVVTKYLGKVDALYNSMCKKGDVLTIYGELYGEGIHGRVNYGEKDFRFFDIQYNGVPVPHGVNILAANAGVQHVPVLATGEFKDVLEFKQEFTSYLTPVDHQGENFAEGVVIAPWEPRFLADSKRVILKKKHPKFFERQEKKLKPPQNELSGTDRQVLAELLQYNTESRVYSVMSKMGEITQKDFGRLMGETIKDLLEEWGGDIKKSCEEPKRVSKAMQKEVAPVVKKVFLERV